MLLQQSAKKPLIPFFTLLFIAALPSQLPAFPSGTTIASQHYTPHIASYSHKTHFFLASGVGQRQVGRGGGGGGGGAIQRKRPQQSENTALPRPNKHVRSASEYGSFLSPIQYIHHSCELFPTTYQLLVPIVTILNLTYWQLKVAVLPGQPKLSQPLHGLPVVGIAHKYRNRDKNNHSCIRNHRDLLFLPVLPVPSTPSFMQVLRLF